MEKSFFNRPNKLNKSRDDFYLILIVIVLVFIGITAINSCSYMVNTTDPNHCLQRHCFNIFIGIMFFVFASIFDYRKYQKHNFIMFLITTILLIVPFFCREINGAHRWITFSFTSFNFQPSELAKLVLVIIMSNFLAKHKEYINTAKANIFPTIYLGTFVLIIYFLQRDLGTALLLSLIWFTLLLIAKIDTKRILIIILVSIVFGLLAMLSTSYRRARLLVYTQPIIEFFVGKNLDNYTNEKIKMLKKIDDDSYNSNIAFAALGSGGILGKGVGKSEMKLKYLPEMQTDYIFPIIGEEHGLKGTLLVVLLFMFFTKVALSINKKCNNDFGKFLSFGIILIIATQAIINMGMTTGLLPAKGFPLPFISYGGSSMFVNFFMVGILINIAKNNRKLL